MPLLAGFLYDEIAESWSLATRRDVAMLLSCVVDALSEVVSTMHRKRCRLRDLRLSPHRCALSPTARAMTSRQRHVSDANTPHDQGLSQMDLKITAWAPEITPHPDRGMAARGRGCVDDDGLGPGAAR
jgi:hypothetical protein